MELLEKTKKILILGNSHLTVFGFRGELITHLLHEGYDVTVSFPNGPFGNGEKTSREYGCKFCETNIERRKTNPISDIKLVFDYIKLIRTEKPDIVLAYTVKCDVYGGIASRLRGVPFIPNITGLGKGLDDGGIVSKILIVLYKIALKNANTVFFQNDNDSAFFAKNRICTKKGEILPGSGVNLEKFKPLDYPVVGPTRFIYIARVMKAKGIDQFLDAAKALAGKAEFHICGYCEEDYKPILNDLQNAGIIYYHGLVQNILEYEKFSHCVVLPSYHPEGISNVLLEAASCARPVITTNRPGCRETVKDGVTGFLINERDSKDLIEKMELFLSMKPEERREMGLRGRRKMEAEFDRNIVIARYMETIHHILSI